MIRAYPQNIAHRGMFIGLKVRIAHEYYWGKPSHSANLAMHLIAFGQKLIGSNREENFSHSFKCQNSCSYEYNNPIQIQKFLTQLIKGLLVACIYSCWQPWCGVQTLPSSSWEVGKGESRPGEARWRERSLKEKGEGGSIYMCITIHNCDATAATLRPSLSRRFLFTKFNLFFNKRPIIS